MKKWLYEHKRMVTGIVATPLISAIMLVILLASKASDRDADFSEVYVVDEECSNIHNRMQNLNGITIHDSYAYENRDGREYEYHIARTNNAIQKCVGIISDSDTTHLIMEMWPLNYNTTQIKLHCATDRVHSHQERLNTADLGYNDSQRLRHLFEINVLDRLDTKWTDKTGIITHLSPFATSIITPVNLW